MREIAWLSLKRLGNKSEILFMAQKSVSSAPEQTWDISEWAGYQNSKYSRSSMKL